ncbi:MAG: RimK family alpha-L-glutamate ligase [Nanoarchaeota archaeon]|nr:RimK family alpha-L-glutamate ligase [Nanoarchaeota archaeon]
MKIGIISLGGESSLQLAQACKKYFKKVDLLDIKQFEVHLTDTGVNVTYDKRDLDKYDCLYIRGSFRYALLQRSITRALHNKTYMPMVPSAFTIGHDKFLTLLELQKKKLPIPKTYYAASPNLAKKLLEKVKYPVILKVAKGTHGKGVMMADSLQSAKTILDMLDEFKEPFIIQEFVKTKKTTDIRAIVAGKKILASYKRKAAVNEVRANTHLGGTRLAHELTDEEKRLAISSAKALGADICGVDILNAKKPSVIEVNLSPSLYTAKEITGKDVLKDVSKYLYKKTKEFKELKRKKRNGNGHSNGNGLGANGSGKVITSRDLIYR